MSTLRQDPIQIADFTTQAPVSTGDTVNKAERTNDVVAGPVIVKRFGAVTLGTPQTVNASGDTTVYTPTAGKSIRLKWLGLSSPSTNTANTTVTVKLGGTTIYIWELGAPGAFAHAFVREGPVNGLLVVNLTANQVVRVNFDLEEFP
jgi:hypothetical protein